MMRCDKCGSDNPNSQRFCGNCGTALLAISETATIPGAGSPASSPSPLAGLPEGERKTVTALFADIKGSTELMRHLDPEEARSIIDPALKVMIEAVNRYDGY